MRKKKTCLLHLELDGALQLLNLSWDVVAVVEWRRELAGLVETTTENLLQLLDNGVGGEEGVVRVGQLLDLLVLFVQLLEVLKGHAWDVVGLGLVAVLFVSQHAYSELRLRDVLESKLVSLDLEKKNFL